jgi:hypothetical protein
LETEMKKSSSLEMGMKSGRARLLRPKHLDMELIFHIPASLGCSQRTKRTSSISTKTRTSSNLTYKRNNSLTRMKKSIKSDAVWKT